MSQPSRRPSALTSVRLIALGVLAVMLAACGGESAPNDASPTVAATASAAPTPLSPQVATTPASPPEMPTTPPASLSNLSLSFVSATHGWLGRGIGRDGQILVTFDGGASWTEQYRGPVTPLLMTFVDDLAALVVGCVVETAPPGCSEWPLLATHDGGKTWTRLPSFRGGEIAAMSFRGAQDGWVVADRCEPQCGAQPARLFATYDGGGTWSQLPLLAATSPLSLQRLDSGIAWVVSENAMFITRDDGATWTSVANPCRLVRTDLTGDFAAGPFDFVDPAHGWIGCTGRNGGGGMAPKVLYRTVDGGLTWQLVAQTSLAQTSLPTPNPPGVGDLTWSGGITDLHFFDATTGWLAVDGPPGSFLYHTDDGGHTWVESGELPSVGADHYVFTDPAHGWAWGGDALLRTADGGAHWQKVEVPQ